MPICLQCDYLLWRTAPTQYFNMQGVCKATKESSASCTLMPSYDPHCYLAKEQLSLLMAVFLLVLRKGGVGGGRGKKTNGCIKRKGKEKQVIVNFCIAFPAILLISHHDGKALICKCNLILIYKILYFPCMCHFHGLRQNYTIQCREW